MKKVILKASLLVFALICILAFTSCQQNNGDVIIGGVEYRIYADFCAVVDIRGIAGWRVEIPSHVEGKPVTSISVDYRWIFFPDIIQARTLIIPDTVTHIDDSVYDQCTYLKYNEYEGGLYLGNDENPYHAFVRPKNSEKDQGAELYAFVASESALPEKETPSLPPYPQSGPNSNGCTIHPDTVIFADAAFASCTGIKSITVPGTVKTLPQYLFAGARDLESIVIEEGVCKVYEGAFNGCTSLKSVSFPDSIEYFGASFYGCESLESVNVPDCVESFGGMFSKCTSLKSVYIGKNIDDITSYTFERCTSLESFEVSEENPNYTVIEGNLYSKDGMTLIKYAGGKSETYFEIPFGVIIIMNCALDSAVNLVEIVIPNSVVDYNSYNLLVGCVSLETVTFGSGITIISGMMFDYENRVKTVNISEAAEVVEAYTLSYCKSLESINVDSRNPYYQTIDGNLYSKDGTVLVKYASGKTESTFEIPDSVRKIGESAFECSRHLISVGMSDQITEIGARAFANCKSLKSIKLSEGVTKVASRMFYGCEKLEYVILGKRVSVIGKEAFNCSGFNVKIYAPRTLQYIERDGLGYADVYFDGTKAEWQKIHERSLEKDPRYSQYQNYSAYCSDGHLFIENQ